MNRTISFISGIILGAIVGSALVLLYTPASGINLRKRMQDYKDQVIEEVKQAAASRRIEMQEQLAHLRQD